MGPRLKAAKGAMRTSVRLYVRSVTASLQSLNPFWKREAAHLVSPGVCRAISLHFIKAPPYALMVRHLLASLKARFVIDCSRLGSKYTRDRFALSFPSFSFPLLYFCFPRARSCLVKDSTFGYTVDSVEWLALWSAYVHAWSVEPGPFAWTCGKHLDTSRM